MNMNSFMKFYGLSSKVVNVGCTMLSIVNKIFIFHLMLTLIKIEFGVFDVIGYFVDTLISLQRRFSSIITQILTECIIEKTGKIFEREKSFGKIFQCQF